MVKNASDEKHTGQNTFRAKFPLPCRVCTEISVKTNLKKMLYKFHSPFGYKVFPTFNKISG
jgi:hypothetical protein